jgi:hypothetical protein
MMICFDPLKHTIQLFTPELIQTSNWAPVLADGLIVYCIVEVLRLWTIQIYPLNMLAISDKMLCKRF